MSFPQSPAISSLLVPNTFLSILFSNVLCLISSLNVTDQVSHPYKATGKKKEGINQKIRDNAVTLTIPIFIAMYLFVIYLATLH
jgi:hypothetical protein